MKRISFSLGLVAALASVSACSTNVTFTGGTGGSGGQGGRGGTGGGGGSDDVCSRYDDETSTRPVSITVTNDSPLTLFIPTDCDDLRVDIQSLDGDDALRYTLERDFCSPTCGDLQRGEPVVCGACQQSVRMIEPGESYTLSWDGMGLESVEMPAQCWFSSFGDSSCSRRINAPRQTYRLDIQAYSECDAFDPDASCECVDGLCFGDAGGSKGYHDTAVVNLGDDDTIDVVFGPCAFGCADEG